MSRIGSKNIQIPDNVKVNYQNNVLNIEGPKGKTSIIFPQFIDCKINDNKTISITRSNNSKEVKALHGTMRARVNNAIKGVVELFKKELEIKGAGYKAEIKKNNELVLSLGKSHQIIIKPFDNINITCPSATKIVVTGIDKQLVGEQAAIIRRQRKPDPYKGQGVRYVGENIVLRESSKGKGKTATTK